MVAQPTKPWPTHLDLPDKDGLPDKSGAHPFQRMLLTSAVERIFDERHPDRDYCIGSNVGIYWRATDPPLDGCVVPDWCYIPGCRPTPPRQFRRSFVTWDEGVSPLLVVDIALDDGALEHDDTPWKGKFWIYRRGLGVGYVAIHNLDAKTLELYERVGAEFRRVEPNAKGLLEIEPLGLALGHWRGTFYNQTLTWVRFFWPDGTMIPIPQEIVANIRRAREEKARADKTEADLAALLAKLQAKGIDPNTL